MSVKHIKSYCRDCCKNTNHNVLSEHTDAYREEYSCDISYQILQCLGCDTKSFRNVFYDLEAAYPTDENNWEVPEEVTVYPKAVEGHKEIKNLWDLPDIVRTIYSEVLTALRENSKVLAGLGLRAVVEAVCNDLTIPGRNLEVRINKLVSSGYISKNDAERLHGIRFMGNDAAHDIKTPKSTTLSVALQIVEHLIASVYILENQANGNIESTVSRYEVFENLLSEKLKNFSSGDEYPIAKYLGKDMRRVKESISKLEQELISKIDSGEYTKLSVGKLDTYQSSESQLRHFIVK
ncbi:DUF4145 domain-containing protein [Escherichia coli]|uniref:DUF4145 domain-containing protein n=1 Tax=Escherichia coli TaxID=562 RepID=UPI000945A147|nr:DUF4145 domain-containing protein [Escherichia coli]EEZ5689910.1 DUF4145 domain-containing protein [Escherichia coli O25]EFA4037915.1 DUF4145 domain-containing protein [Escherichia coli O120:H10]EEZ9694606.1 DUF4145 domain-containing protein [Escherichia coli O25]EFG7991665.1 DUF4145 domain-containing protein [Escherichia coli]EFI1495649.1 DUF4145 domain-containing protein [Escherichia coli]